MGLQEHEIGCGLFEGKRGCTCMYDANCVECGWIKFRTKTNSCISCGGIRRIIHADVPDGKVDRENTIDMPKV